MRNVILISIVLLFISLMSCNKFKLSKEELKWQPYIVDDILVFESNIGEIDSIKIISIDSYLNPKDPLAVFPDQHESLFVNGKLLNPNEGFEHLDHVNFLNFFSSKKTYVVFNLMKISDSLEYATAKYTINQLNAFYDNKKIVNICIANVIKLEPNFTGGLEYEYDLETYWWSREYGYIQYNFKNGYYRKLKKFIRGGENILPQCYE